MARPIAPMANVRRPFQLFGFDEGFETAVVHGTSRGGMFRICARQARRPLLTGYSTVG
jgi:hypothetical protein